MRRVIYIVLIIFIVAACRQPAPRVEFTTQDIRGVITQMTDIMVHDVTNPPLAARFFSYACLAGYEVVAQNDKNSRSMKGLLRDYPSIQKPDGIQEYSYQVSALLAMMEVAKKIQPSGKRFESYEQNFLDSCRQVGYPEEVIQSSLQYAEHISRQILDYAKQDHYNRISNYPRYTPLNKDGYWYPTPPAYFAAIEPYFNTVRPFTVDSCTQFKPQPPVPFSIHKDSAFFKLMLLNYKETLPSDRRDIAAFWDCNPFAVQDNGHLLVGLKKISPGAHWLGITGIACEKGKKSFAESMKIFTTVAVGLMDAFICCWDEKYRSNRIRPETAIRKYIDANWTPILQTPPFPEYLSGHSVISASSATILTHYFGNDFYYVDDVEVPYGLPSRKFGSFIEAAKEAAISRFYGGIHFMDAIDNGFVQGVQVGQWVLNKIEKKPINK